MAKTPQEVGKEFEEAFQAYLKSWMHRHQLTFIRLYDTRSAGTYLPNQPGDFVMAFRGQAHLWELKSSDKHDSLAGGLADLVSKQQATHHKLWTRAGATTHFLFLAQATGEVELWHGGHVAEIKHTPRARLSRHNCLRWGSIESFADNFLNLLLTNNKFGAPEPSET